MALVNKLPTEFFQKVANYLSLKDCYHCLFVSRLWHHTFQRTLYKTIRISSEDQLESLGISLPYYGHLVKEIYFTTKEEDILQQEVSIVNTTQPQSVVNTLLDQASITKLNEFCPLLEVFDFEVTQWTEIDLSQLSVHWTRMRSCAPLYFSDLIKQDFFMVFGNNLTKLHIGYYPDEMNQLVNKVSAFNQLQDLTLEIILENDQVPWNNSSGHLERIHMALPQLKTLRLIRQRTPRQESNALVGSDYLLPFEKPTQIETLSLHGHVDSVKWFEFIISNYPHLKELRLTQLSTSRFGTKFIWQNGLVDLINALPQLKSITLGGRNIPQLFSSSLAKALKNPTCAVQNLYVDFETYQAIESCQFLLVIAMHGLQQLRYLRLRVWEQIPGWSGVTNNLFQCHGLVSLHLSLSKGLTDQFPFTPFLIDHFLNNLPQLQVLGLVGANVQVTYNHFEDLDFGVFALKQLELSQSKVENYQVVFQYLSACCPQLNQVLLKRCETERKRINLSRLLNACVLDLRNSRLEKIVLSTLLIYVGTIQSNKFIGIQLKYGDELEEKMIWCKAMKSMVYPIYSVNEDEEENQDLDQLYKSYSGQQVSSDCMPGNYTPSIGVITIYCKSVEKIYLDLLRIK